MRIGINGVMLAGPSSGATRRIECMSQALVRLGHEVVLYTSDKAQIRIPNLTGLRITPLPIPHQPATSRALAEQRKLPKLFAEDKLDLAEWSHFPVPDSEVPTLVTIHDLRHLSIPKFSPISRRLFGKSVYQSAAKKARKLIAVSDFTRNEIVKHLKVDESQISVIPNAGNHLNPPSPMPARNKAILYVGHLERRKNLDVVLEAFSKLRTTEKSFRFRIAGRGEEEANLRAKVTKLQIGDAVDWLGVVEDSTLPMLYASSEMLVFPSLYEGFGIPVLEAMRCKTPVIASRSSAIPEVGGDACLYAETSSVDSWLEGMKKLSQDAPLRQALVERGAQNESRYRWEKSAERLVEAGSKL